MDLLKMTNRAKVHEFFKKIKLGKFVSFKKKVLKFGDLFGVWKLATNANYSC